MGWFSRRSSRPDAPAGQIAAGRQASPGLTVFAEQLERCRPESLLDLGPSSTENLEFFSGLVGQVVIGDLFHRVGERGQRAEIFTFDDPGAVPLPDEPERFGALVLWDLLHYFRPADRRRFVERLLPRLEPGAPVLVHASSVAAVPPTPIQFKAVGPGELDYVVGRERVPPPGLNTREVERALAGLEPVRLIQLRNGYIELVFRAPDAPARVEAPPG